MGINIEFGDRYSSARTYHQLGYVAQELREYDQARDYYQQALEIYIEFGDRYSCARTYYQLGKVAEELGELEEAKANYLQDLVITTEFNDEHGLGVLLRNLAGFYQTTQDEDLLREVAKIFKTTVEELKEAIINSEE
jgi:tetratricopeptide (TPR) repeat protein